MTTLSSYYINAPAFPWPFDDDAYDRAPAQAELRGRERDLLITLRQLGGARGAQELADSLGVTRGIALSTMLSLTKKQMLCRIGVSGQQNIRWQITSDGLAAIGEEES